LIVGEVRACGASTTPFYDSLVVNWLFGGF